jgi:hypothetical protein
LCFIGRPWFLFFEQVFHDQKKIQLEMQNYLASPDALNSLLRKQIYPAHSVTPGKISLRESLADNIDICEDNTKNNRL